MNLTANSPIYFAPKNILKSKRLSSVQKVILILMFNDQDGKLTLTDLELMMAEPKQQIMNEIFDMAKKGILENNEDNYSLKQEILTKLDWTPTVKKGAAKKKENTAMIQEYVKLIKELAPNKTIIYPEIEKQFNKISGIELSIELLKKVILGSLSDANIEDKYKTPEYWLRPTIIARYSATEQKNQDKKPLSWKQN